MRKHVPVLDGTRVSFSFDPVGNRSQMQDAIGTTTYSYDALNRLSGKTDPGSLVQAYSFDSVSNRTKLVDPDGNVRTMAFDALNRLLSMTTDGGTVFSYSYDPASRQTQLGQSSPAGLTSWGFDASGNTVSLSQYDNAATLQASFAYGYDNDNFRSSVSDLDGSTTTYSYDKKHRLVQSQRTGPNALNALYSYDGNDNILTNNEIGQTQTLMYDAANRLTSVLSFGGTVWTFSFDANGNETLIQTASLTTNLYDKENRLSQYQLGSYVFKYSYSGDGMKRVENINGALTTLVWDGDDYLQGRS